MHTSPFRDYSIVSGFFAQDDPNADPSSIPAFPPRLGLLDDSPDHWDKFKTRVAELNRTAPAGTTYKVLFLGRHGQGFHNVGEQKYGTKAWDDYWSKLNGDGEITWGPDPLLTELGNAQAEAARSAWTAEMVHGIPMPERCYASPLHRALSTWDFTFNKSVILGKQNVTILENLREEFGEHTCDMRNPLSKIYKNFPPPVYTAEPGFTEEDLIWGPERETKAQVKERAGLVLDRIFERDEEVYISITAHGGIINGLLASMGRSPYALTTGGILPLVVKAGVRFN
ncbi:histidine phosphatase superfamily [Sparassis latifolia]|uniref:Probable phosphoglycerate n=1 Tax=Sparassis crispa TaxID=139825 RepID=A0A401GLT8_9APHY|nr:Probable phosphoglycerate [Sparassis crispa]GBE83130.1 Probable phosphoglycerate [Sparassis crispa]